MMDRWHRRIMMLAVIVGVAAPVLAQEPPAQNCLVEAQNSYRNMHLSQTIEVLKQCRDRGWPGLVTTQRIDAFRLLSLSYFARHDTALARSAVVGLLEEDRRYRSDPLKDPVFFQELVRELRRPWYLQRWVLVGGAIGGGLVTCAIAGCFTSDPTSPTPLPGTEGFPLPDPPSN